MGKNKKGQRGCLKSKYCITREWNSIIFRRGKRGEFVDRVVCRLLHVCKFEKDGSYLESLIISCRQKFKHEKLKY